MLLTYVEAHKLLRQKVRTSAAVLFSLVTSFQGSLYYFIKDHVTHYIDERLAEATLAERLRSVSLGVVKAEVEKIEARLDRGLDGMNRKHTRTKHRVRLIRKALIPSAEEMRELCLAAISMGAEPLREMGFGRIERAFGDDEELWGNMRWVELAREACNRHGLAKVGMQEQAERKEGGS